ncbi:FAD-binding domain-containing protein [Ideonella margarita]|uniref:FAD-binding domain-containing protein n=1 Tax=Ideonella margarita TaxID=2984191 RepID=A0ABU9C4X6_9BURK
MTPIQRWTPVEGQPQQVADPAAARAALRQLRPADYAHSRNHLGGAVTGLSPWLTHGVIDPPDVAAAAEAALGSPLPPGHALTLQLAWREYFLHVAEHRGAGLLQSLHEGPLPDALYASTVPDDVRAGRTGVPVIDQAVHQLHACGWLHNHARLWLASYLVHMRRVHWRAGADWLHALLLDGDLPSNHLSWQWVAGTGSHKPYVFNADNVARFAPRAWHSPGTVIDTSYEQLDAIARGQVALPQPYRAAQQAAVGSDAPVVSSAPPTELAALLQPPAAGAPEWAGQPVWLVHPWALGDVPDDLPPNTVVLAVLCEEFHRAWPWSAQRWQFVLPRMAALARSRGADAGVISGTSNTLLGLLKHAGPVMARQTWQPHYRELLEAGRVTTRPVPARCTSPDTVCASFSKFWSRQPGAERFSHRR